MTWNQWYHFRSYLRSSLWVVPFFAMPLALVAVNIFRLFDRWLQWNFLGLNVQGAQSLLQATVTATLSFMVFTFGSLLVAIQVASAQLTPRVIATTLLRNDVVRYTVGLFIFTFIFALSAQDRMQTTVDELVVFAATILAISCFAAFFYLIDYASRLLRPVSILARVANDGLAVITSVYPNPSIGSFISKSQHHKLGEPHRIIRHEGPSKIILAVNLEALVAESVKANGVVEFIPQVGDFVAADEPLFNLFGTAREIDDDLLRATVAFGSERTMEQDPTFSFRIVVDIALRALSSAINDPTTAVLAIDQLQRLLRVAGNRNLRTDENLDKSGKLRVIVRTPNWEDFVTLAFSEIRRCGSNNLQIARRLRAMIKNLTQTLPKHRHAALLQELRLLDFEIEKHFTFPEELELAYIADTQGLGGHSGKSKRRQQ